MAGVIAVAGKKCYMADYGTLMVHNPTGGNDKKVLALVKDTLVTILTNRTNQKEEDIIKMMDKETWLNSKQALELGMVDEIVSSSKKVKMPENSSLYDMALIYNKVINPKKNMTKINTLLKISNDANESEQEMLLST
jgi:ClpP class serine protease